MMTMISPPPDHAGLQALLAARDWELTAAELHGSLCGYLGSHGAAPGLAWLDAVVDEPVSADLVDSERRQLLALAEASWRALEEGEYAFALLLPDDPAPLAQRVTALGQWCDGFVGGLGLGGLKRQNGLSATGREAVEDLARIARTELTLDDDGDADGDEQAFIEVLEFTRMAAVLVFEELRESRMGRPSREPGSRRHAGNHGHRSH
jgi:uncharacterized protein